MVEANQITLESLQEFSNLEFLAKQIVEGFITGLHRSPYHGFSVEFLEHRLYNTGESTRNIDWKLFARTDKLFVKRFEEETNLRCQLVIDTSSSMFFPKGKTNKIHFAAYTTAAILQLIKGQRDAFGLHLFNDKLNHSFPAKSSTLNQRLILNQLEMMISNPAENQTTNLPHALHVLSETLPRRSLVILFSDMFGDPENKDALFSALQHLKFNKHEVLLFHVLDNKNEVDLNLPNRPHLFIDLETGEKVKLNPAQIQEEYKSAVEEFRSEIINKCGQFKIDYIEADINLGFKQVLQSYLIKRQKMM